jgi:UDP-2,4-diacetamido-2,4,6-trideoxy-beta-L-altropyranose hydrolase
MRCLALAQAWHERGGDTVFLSVCANKALWQRIASVGLVCIPLEQGQTRQHDLQTMLATLARLTPDVSSSHVPWVVLDGYHFDASYQRTIRTAGYRAVVIDDIAHLPQYHADVLLNQNIHAATLPYCRDADTILLLGPRYALLRPEFLAWRGWQRSIPAVARKVLVTMGGSDPDNLTWKVVQALQQIEVDGLEITVVLGANYPHTFPADCSIAGLPCTVVRHTLNMPALMAWADVLVGAGGSTCWEMAFMGLPAALAILAENQQPVVQGLAAAGIGMPLGWHTALSPATIATILRPLLEDRPRRAAMAHRGQQIVDGKGVERVLMQLAQAGIRLRPVQADDCRLLWEWANDPDVRQASFSSAPIPWEQHTHWFTSKIASPKCILYIALSDNNTPIGQVRYDIDGDEAVISISLAHQFRRQGYGSYILQKASQQLFECTPVHTIHAYVKQDNQASARAFVKAGYEEQGVTMMHGCQAIHLALQKKEIS